MFRKRFSQRNIFRLIRSRSLKLLPRYGPYREGWRWRPPPGAPRQLGRCPIDKSRQLLTQPLPDRPPASLAS